MRANPSGILAPPPVSGMPYARLVEVAPPIRMLGTDPIGTVFPPPSGVAPGVAVVVVAPLRLRRQRLGKRLELGVRDSAEEQHQERGAHQNLNPAHLVPHVRARRPEQAREFIIDAAAHRGLDARRHRIVYPRCVSQFSRRGSSISLPQTRCNLAAARAYRGIEADNKTLAWRHNMKS